MTKLTVTLNELWIKIKYPVREEIELLKDEYTQEMYKELIYMMPELQWTKANLSIISPSWATFWKYELYDWNETFRFDTLEEAQTYWDNLLSKN